MGEGISAHQSGDFDLTAGDQRPTHRGTEEIFTRVSRASAEGGRRDRCHECLTQTCDVALIGTRCDGLGAHALKLFALTDGCGDADDAGTVAVLERGNDY